MQRILLLAVTSLAMLTHSLVSHASGGSSRGFSGSDSRSLQQQRPVDQSYEAGKAIYTGRAKGEPSLDYCIVVEGEKVPLKRKTVKTYKQGTYNEFAESLYRCDEPDSLIADSLTRDSLLYVIYYLNKRHKLNLRGS